MTEIEIRVFLLWPEQKPSEFEILTGAPDEPVLPALLRRNWPADEPIPEGMSLYLMDEGPFSERWDRYSSAIEVDATVTFAQFAQVTGGRPVVVDPGGWGGDALWWEPLVSVAEILGWGLTVHGVWSLVKDGTKSFASFRYRSERELAEAWRDSDDPAVPMPLKQAVLARSGWYRRRFDYVFNLDDVSGTKLLKVLGYRKVRSTPDAIWLEEGAPDSLADDDEYLGASFGIAGRPS